MSSTSALTAFRRTTRLIAAGNPLPVVLEAIVEAVEAENPAIIGSIHMLDRTGKRLMRAAAPHLSDAYKDAIDGAEIGPNVGSCGTAAYLNRRVIVEDIASDPLWVDYKHLAEAEGVAACWSEPIRAADGQVVGTFAIYHREVSAPTADDIAFIEAAAEVVLIAIERDRAHQDLVRSREAALKAAEFEREAARNLTTFFDVSLDMLCIRDMEGRFIKVNQAWETTLGYSIEELEGAKLINFIHPDDLENTRGVMKRVDHAAGEVVGYINRYRRKDGVYRHFEWRARRVGDKVFGVARDVTERLAIEADMQAAKAEAEAASRAKSDFLANMSHEIRTPLNGVIGVVAALGQTELTPAQHEMVDLIEGSGVMLERLVSDILDISKIEAGRMEIETRVFDLQDDLGAVVELARSTAHGKNLSFRLESSDQARGEFWGDATRIKQVLGNLLSNAVKFTAEGEVSLTITATEPPGDGEPTRLVFEVADSGVGFDPATAETLFQRFSQADTTITRRFGGTGLGLSICQALVDMMGGDISASSEPGRGSLFRVVLPLLRSRPLADYDAERAQPADAGRYAPTPLRPGLRVLLAEDHPTNQKVVELILAPYEAKVMTVANGQLAIEAFVAERFDLVLMDMQMPVLDGLAATVALRRYEAQHADRPRTPLVMLSANAMQHHRDEALAAGADLHVPKPITAKALVAGIEAVLSPSAAPAVGASQAEEG